MDESQVSACSFTEWYPAFSRHTFTSEMLPLPPRFTDFVTQDGVFLPESSTAIQKRSKSISNGVWRGQMPRRQPIDPYAVKGVDYTEWSDSDTTSRSSTSDSCSLAEAQSVVDMSQFPEFQRQIDEAIGRLGGKVLPKLNWSAPKDAWWVTSTQTMACTTSDEVLLLMQSSDRIVHDVCHAYDFCGSSSDMQSQAVCPIATLGSRPPLTLVLRQWHTILPGREFRCFVHRNQVVGISQRDLTQRFDFLPAAKQAVREAILTLHHRHIADSFPLEDYTYDVYVSATNSIDKVIDFNPAGGVTALLLFDSWSELGISDSLSASSSSSSAHSPRLQASMTNLPKGSDPSGVADLSLDNLSPAVSHTAASTTQDLSKPCPRQRLGDKRHDASTGKCNDIGGSHERQATVHRQVEGAQVDFRIVTERVVMRSEGGGYGVPFDFVHDDANAAVGSFARAYHDSQH